MPYQTGNLGNGLMVSLVCFVCQMAISGPSYGRKVSLGTFSSAADGGASVEQWGKRPLCVLCATLQDRSRPKPGKALAAAALAAAAVGGFLFWNGSFDAAPQPSDSPTVLAFDVTGAKPMTTGGGSAGKGVRLVITRDKRAQTDMTLEEAVQQLASMAPQVEMVDVGRAPNASSNSLTSSFAPPGQEAPAPGASLAAGVSKLWPNTTLAGTRWTLRPRDKGTMMLRIDLGLQQVASLIVPPEWDTADPERFEAMVDRLREVVLQRFPLQSALFMFWRDAKLSLIPVP